MLFVTRENKAVQNLAAGNGGVVAQNGVDKASAVFQVGVVAHNETYRDARIENMTAVTHDTIHQNHAFANLRRLFQRRIDGDVFQFAGPFDVARTANFHILDDGGILDDGICAHRAIITTTAVVTFLGKLQKLGLQFFIVNVTGF